MISRESSRLLLILSYMAGTGYSRSQSDWLVLSTSSLLDDRSNAVPQDKLESLVVRM